MCFDSVLQGYKLFQDVGFKFSSCSSQKVKVQSFTRPQLEEWGNFLFCFAELSFYLGGGGVLDFISFSDYFCMQSRGSC